MLNIITAGTFPCICECAKRRYVKPPTHTAYVLKRESRTTGSWLEIGTSNIGSDGIKGTHHVDIDRLPVGASVAI
jgi:hypothetical protein